MVLLIIIPFFNGYFIGNINPTFSDKSIFKHQLKKTACQMDVSRKCCTVTPFSPIKHDVMMKFVNFAGPLQLVSSFWGDFWISLGVPTPFNGLS